MTKKHFAFIIILLTLSVYAVCQVEEKVSQEERVKEKEPIGRRFVFGGDIGLSFGSVTYIKLAPVVGYRITDRLTAGLGPIYIFQKVKYPDNWETSIYGGKTYVSFTVYRGSQRENRFGIGDVFLHVENEVVNVERNFDTHKRIWIDNMLLGAGLYQPLGARFGVSVYVLWDITQNPYSLMYYRQNPVVKFGFNF